MLVLSINELKETSKVRGKGYKSMSKDRLLNALNASESIGNKDYDADEAKIRKKIVMKT